jgi:RND family efflux transporter MFP subunit
MNRSWTRYLLPLVIIAVAVAIAMVMMRSRSELPRREREEPIPLVDVVEVRPGPVAITIRSQGTVKAKREIDLVSEVSGRVIEVAPELQEGAQVPGGTPLLRIDPIDYEVAVSDAKAAVAAAEFALAEVTAILKRAAIDEAEARLQASRDRLRQAETDLANTEISAPFDAVIDKQHVDQGQYVQTGMSLMYLLGTDRVEVRLPILAPDVPYLQPGPRPDGTWSPVTLSAQFGSLEQTWQGRQLRLEQRVDDETRVFYLVAEVDKPYDTSVHPQPLLVGLFVQAAIQGSTIENATVIPRSALHNGNQVFLFEDGRLRLREVTVRRREANTVIIDEGLTPGDLLVLSRLDLMVDGMPVSVKES